MANQFRTNGESVKVVAKPPSLARGQRRLEVSSRKHLALGQVGLVGCCTALGVLQRRCSRVLPAPGLSLQTEELHPA